MALFRRSRNTSPAPLFVAVHLNARVQPVHRGSVYEDPLQAAFDQYLPGSQLVGGGSEFDPESGVLSCDTEVTLVGERERAVDILVQCLEFQGAPVGSSYTVEGEAPVPFGRTHGVALSLDGKTLPDEVYADNDVNDLVSALTEELGDAADLQSWWEGPERTDLFFYGEDKARIRAVLESAPDTSPLARNSRVEDLT